MFLRELANSEHVTNQQRDMRKSVDTMIKTPKWTQKKDIV